MTNRQVWAAAGLAAAVVAALLSGVARFGRARPDSRPQPICDPELPRFPGDDEMRREFDSLDARQRAVFRRVLDKHAVADALVRDELTLAEAADRFRAIAGDDRALLDGLRRRHPGAPDAELWRRNVLGFARAAVARHGGPGPGPLARLEAELAATFRGPTAVPDAAEVRPSPSTPGAERARHRRSPGGPGGR